jgi:hypothetical protein
VHTEASLPLVRALLDGGMSQGAALAFLITGAGTSFGALAGALTVARRRVVGLVIATLWAGGYTLRRPFRYGSGSKPGLATPGRQALRQRTWGLTSGELAAIDWLRQPRRMMRSDLPAATQNPGIGAITPSPHPSVPGRVLQPTLSSPDEACRTLRSRVSLYALGTSLTILKTHGAPRVIHRPMTAKPDRRTARYSQEPSAGKMIFIAM